MTECNSRDFVLKNSHSDIAIKWYKLEEIEDAHACQGKQAIQADIL